MHLLAQLQGNETVLVSGATGAVGSIVVQLCKLKGCHVIGTTRSYFKASFLQSIGLGRDDIITIGSNKDEIYEQTASLHQRGVNVFFDLVGGVLLDAALACLGHGALVVSIGEMSQEGCTELEKHGIKNTKLIIDKRLVWKGFDAREFSVREDEACQFLSLQLKEGLLQPVEHIIHGFDQIPAAFISTLNNEACGKVVVCVEDLEEVIL